MLTSLPSFNDLFRLGRNIRLHGNRFIQIDVGVETRVHVWSDILPMAQCRPAPIHDHDYDFDSIILSGQLINVQYRIAQTLQRFMPSRMEIGRAWENDQCYDIWHVNRKDNSLEESPKSCILKLSRIDYYRRGQAYRMWSQWLHATAYVGHAITCVNVTNRHPKALRVMIPHGVAPDNEYRRNQYHEDLLWNLVERVYSSIPQGKRSDPLVG